MIQNTINANSSSFTTPRYVIVSIETMLKLKETVVIDSVKSAKYNLIVPKYTDCPNSSTLRSIGNIIHKKVNPLENGFVRFEIGHVSDLRFLFLLCIQDLSILL